MHHPAPSTATRTLDAGWRVRELHPRGTSPCSELGWLPAETPGHVHLDLMRAGVIEDPFKRMHERGCAWVDETDWVYETRFDVDDPEAHAILRFNGLDTVAEITLNGAELGRTANMHVPHEFCVDGRLQRVGNVLTITFASALRTGRELRQAWADAGNDAPGPNWFSWGPRSFVRKVQSMFGWDWGPELVSCGIWQPVELITMPVARITDRRHTPAFDADGPARVTVTVEVERAPGQADAPLDVVIGLPALLAPTDPEGDAERLPTGLAAQRVSVPCGDGRATVSATFEIQEPRLWAPWELGAPNLYELGLRLERPDGALVETERTHRIGLRQVELVREAEADGGESFRFRINGCDLFAKGANWIPADSFPSRDPGGVALRIDGQIAAARRAGMNMLRVWGGGLYETEAFYNACDREGILVWQDFAYGCAYYPDTGRFAEVAAHEAQVNVRRIAGHASIALWCGNNENHMMHADAWGGRENRPARYLGERLYHEVLPSVVAQEDPATPYWPSSPYGGASPNASEAGDRHNWDVWHGSGDWTRYTEDNARFLSEFGFAASCGMAAWEGCLAPADKSPRSAAVRWHDKTQKGYETYMGYLRDFVPEPRTLEDLVYFSQINQAEALKCGIEHWRRLKGRCWGAIFWQFNDCWPVQSWAVVDHALEPKLAYYAARRFYAPLLVSLVRRGNTVEAHVANDRLTPVSGELRMTLATFEGEEIASSSAAASVPAGGTGCAGTLDIAAATGRERHVAIHACLTEPDGAEQTNLLLLARTKELILPDPGLTVEVAQGADGPEACLAAKRFAAYVWLRLEGEAGLSRGLEIGDNGFHLLPGEIRRVALPKLGLEELRARLRVRTL